MTKRIIICGGRRYGDLEAMFRVLSEYAREQPTIVNGRATGADQLAAHVARELGLSCEEHPALWVKHGRAAGPIRNEEMAKLGADLCIAFPGGHGTEDMVRRAQSYGIPVRRIHA